MYRDQFEEFVCGYWGLKGQLVYFSWFITTFFSTPVVALSAIFQTKGLVNIPIKAPDYLLKSSKFVKKREFGLSDPIYNLSFFQLQKQYVHCTRLTKSL